MASRTSKGVNFAIEKYKKSEISYDEAMKEINKFEDKADDCFDALNKVINLETNDGIIDAYKNFMSAGSKAEKRTMLQKLLHKVSKVYHPDINISNENAEQIFKVYNFLFEHLKKSF